MKNINSDNWRQEFREDCTKKLSEMSDDQLIQAYNREVGINAWGNARADFLVGLGDEIRRRDFDSSLIFHEHGMSLRRQVHFVHGKLEYKES